MFCPKICQPMKILNLYQPYSIERVCKNAGQSSLPVYKNTFFEMIFVMEGKGVQYINDLSLPYTEDKLFLTFPQDTYGFDVEEPTTFFILRFNSSFIQAHHDIWCEKLQYIFQRHNHLPGCILKNVADKPLIRSLAEALLREQEYERPHKEEVTEQLVCSMIAVAARNIELMNIPSTDFTPVNGIAQILDYIHQNISRPEKLKVSVMALHFNISETYFCEYFKKRTGNSPIQYIAAYKLRLIERQLQFSDQRINEMAQELGFNDTSHFNHFFKKHKGIPPLKYREEARNSTRQDEL